MVEIKVTTLEYHIVGCSGHSGHYRADNILVDIPTDQTSRWSGQDFPSSLHEQWILLRLNKPSSVKFGKTLASFIKANHPCNTKDFRIYAGPTSDTLTEVYKGSLKNDSTAEEFEVRSATSTGVTFPTEFVKIVPLSAHSTSYHTSIWHVALKGVSDPQHIQQLADVYDKHTEDNTTRIVLKYLRDRGFTSAYQNLLTESQVKLENTIVERLHEAVLAGEYASAEGIVSEAASSGLLVQHLSTISPTASWTQRTGDDADGDIPCARGGHAMCIDDKRGMIYIHGGFDGKESLDDFWSYSIADDRWTCIAGHTGAMSLGPGARSCHRMLFDDTTGGIYLLGRLNDRDATEYSKIADKSNESTNVVPPTVGPQPRATEMWLYHTQGPDQGLWTRPLGDGSETGPHTLSEHQMVLVNEKRKIYVCGGRYIDTEKGEVKESGWYIYDISNGSWTTFGPLLHESARFGHSMVYDPKLRHIFIISGQQKDRDLTDMWAFNIDTETAIEVCSDLADHMALQRAVYDSTRHEIYMSCGIKKEHHSTLVYANSDWIYQFNPTNSLKRGRFVKIDPPKVTDEGEQASPVPRCAQQIVYHAASQAYFMHGGNAGTSRHDVHRGSPQVRLDDLWKLELVWPSVDMVIRQALLLIRSQKFNELTRTDPVAALVYLRTDVSAAVDHSSPTETALFQGLMEQLIQSDPLESEEAHSTTTPHLAMTSRRKLFKELIKFFPDDSKEPSLDLLPLVVRSS